MAHEEGLTIRSAVDRYVLHGAVLATMVCAAGLIGLYIVVDISGKLDSFFKVFKTWDTAMPFILRYYALHIPLIFMHVAPFTILIGSIFALAQLEKHNEILAAKAAGISVRRLLTPVLLLAAFVSLLMYANRQWLIPHLAKDIDASEKTITRKARINQALTDLFLRDSAGTWFVIGRYDPSRLTCYKTWIITSKKRGRIIYYAPEAVLSDNGILVKHGTAITDSGSRRMKPEETVSTDLCENDFTARLSRMRLRSYSDLLWLHRRNPRATDVAVTLNRNLAFPLVAVVMTLIGASLMFIKEGRGTFAAIGIALLLCFLYVASENICCEVARQGHIPARTGAWMPVGAFAAVGTFLFTRIRT